MQWKALEYFLSRLRPVLWSIKTRKNPSAKLGDPIKLTLYVFDYLANYGVSCVSILGKNSYLVRHLPG